MRGFHMDAIVTDQAGERERAAARSDESQRKPRLAGTGGSADQDRVGANQDGGGMDCGASHCAARGRLSSNAALKYATSSANTIITVECARSTIGELRTSGARLRNASIRRNTSFTPPPIRM